MLFSVKLLGITLDSTLSFDKHVSNVARSCYFHIHTLKQIRPCLSLDSAKSVALSIVVYKLDYCNSVLFGTSQRSLDKLQCIHNLLARSVVSATWSDNAAEIMSFLCICQTYGDDDECTLNLLHGLL